MIVTTGIDTFLSTADNVVRDPSLDQATLSTSTLYLIKPSQAFPDFSAISTATLTILSPVAVPAGVVLSLRLVAADWQLSTVNGSNVPPLTGTPVVVTTVATPAGSPITFEVSALLQPVADTTLAYLGFGIQMTTGAAFQVWTFDADPSVSPIFNVSWYEPPPTPTNLSPDGGRAVGESQPVLRVLNYAPSLDDIALKAMQVQWSTTTSFTTPIADDTLSVTGPEFDMKQTASKYALPSDGSTRYYRTRLQGSDSAWSQWSQPATTRYVPKPSLVITNPPAAPGNVIPTSQPNIAWTLGGTQAFSQVILTPDYDHNTQLANTHKQPGSVNNATPDYEVTDTSSHWVEVSVWDNVDREATPGQPTQVIAQALFSVSDDPALPVPSQITTAPMTGFGCPFVAVQWQAKKVPDFFKVKRDGVNVSGRLVPSAVLVAPGTSENDATYQWIDYLAQTNAWHEYQVQPVVNGHNGAGGPVSDILTTTTGIWLAHPATGDWITVVNASLSDWAITEPNSASYSKLSGDTWLRQFGNLVAVSTVVSGDLMPVKDRTVDSYHRSLMRMLRAGANMVLVTPHQSLEVLIGDVSSTPKGDPPGMQARAVSFAAWQATDDPGVSFPSQGQGQTVTFDYEQGVDGAALTTAASGASSVFGNPIFSAAGAIHGTMAADSGPTGGTWNHTLLNYLMGSVSSYFRLALPTSRQTFHKISDPGSVDLFTLRIDQTGVIQLFNQIGTPALVAKAGTATATNAPFRVDCAYSYASGILTVIFSLFVGAAFETTTPTDVLTAQVATATPPAQLAYGSAGGGVRVRVDDVRISNQAGTGFQPENPSTVTPTQAYTLMGYNGPTGLIAKSQFVFPDPKAPPMLAGTGIPGDQINMLVSTSPTMSSPTTVGPVTIDSNYMTTHLVNGLTPSSMYYLQLATPDGTPFGDVMTAKTLPPATGSWSLKINPFSCQSNGPDQYSLPWLDMLAWGPDMNIALGDTGGYWGGTIAGSDPFTRDLQKYVNSAQVKPVMRKVWHSAVFGGWLISDHEIYDNGDYNNANNPNGGAIFLPGTNTLDPSSGIHNSPQSIREIQAWQAMTPTTSFGDTRTPMRGRYYSYVIGNQVKVIVLDLRSPDRTTTTDKPVTDPNRTMLGAAQKAWFYSQLDPKKAQPDPVRDQLGGRPVPREQGRLPDRQAVELPGRAERHRRQDHRHRPVRRRPGVQGSDDRWRPPLQRLQPGQQEPLRRLPGLDQLRDQQDRAAVAARRAGGLQLLLLHRSGRARDAGLHRLRAAGAGLQQRHQDGQPDRHHPGRRHDHQPQQPGQLGDRHTARRDGHRQLGAAVTDLGLSRTELTFYENALVSTRQVKINCELWDRSRNLAGVVRTIQDGQVDIDVTASVGRSATLSIADPNNVRRLDSKGLFLDRILRLEHQTYVPELHRYVSCPFFTGPVMKADTYNGVIALEAQGMEIWAMGRIVNPRAWPKGAKVTDVMRTIMHDEVGELPRYISIPDRKDTLPRRFDTIGSATWWDAMVYLAASINCDLFYDGNSTCCVRPQPQPVGYEITVVAILKIPQVSLQLGGTGGLAQSDSPWPLYNAMQVVGAHRPKKPGQPHPGFVTYTAVAPAGNRFAPLSIGHPGTGLLFRAQYTNPHIAKVSTAKSIAETKLKRLLQVVDQVTFTSVVLPHLDPWSNIRMNSKYHHGRFDLMQSSIPIYFSPPDGGMTHNFNDMVSLPPQRFRR